MKKLLSLLAITSVAAQTSTSVVSCSNLQSSSKIKLSSGFRFQDFSLETPLNTGSQLFAKVRQQIADYATGKNIGVTADDIDNPSSGVSITISTEIDKKQVTIKDAESVKVVTNKYDINVSVTSACAWFTDETFNSDVEVNEQRDIAGMYLYPIDLTANGDSTGANLFSQVRQQIADYAEANVKSSDIENPSNGIAISITDPNGKTVNDDNTPIESSTIKTSYKVTVTVQEHNLWFKAGKHSFDVQVTAIYILKSADGISLSSSIDLTNKNSGSSLYDQICDQIADYIKQDPVKGNVSGHDIRNDIFIESVNPNGKLDLKLYDGDTLIPINSSDSLNAGKEYKLQLSVKSGDLYFQTTKTPVTKTFEVTHDIINLNDLQINSFSLMGVNGNPNTGANLWNNVYSQIASQALAGIKADDLVKDSDIMVDITDERTHDKVPNDDTLIEEGMYDISINVKSGDKYFATGNVAKSILVTAPLVKQDLSNITFKNIMVQPNDTAGLLFSKVRNQLAAYADPNSHIDGIDIKNDSNLTISITYNGKEIDENDSSLDAGQYSIDLATTGDDKYFATVDSNLTKTINVSHGKENVTSLSIENIDLTGPGENTGKNLWENVYSEIASQAHAGIDGHAVQSDSNLSIGITHNNISVPNDEKTLIVDGQYIITVSASGDQYFNNGRTILTPLVQASYVKQDLNNVPLGDLDLTNKNTVGQIWDKIYNEIVTYINSSGQLQTVGLSDIQNDENIVLQLQIAGSSTWINKGDQDNLRISSGVYKIKITVKGDDKWCLPTGSSGIVKDFNILEQINMDSLSFDSELYLTKNTGSAIYTYVRKQIALLANANISDKDITPDNGINISIVSPTGAIDDSDKHVISGQYSINITVAPNNPWFLSTSGLTKTLHVIGGKNINDINFTDIDDFYEANTIEDLQNGIYDQMAKFADANITAADIKNAVDAGDITVQILDFAGNHIAGDADAQNWIKVNGDRIGTDKYVININVLDDSNPWFLGTHGTVTRVVKFNGQKFMFQQLPPLEFTSFYGSKYSSPSAVYYTMTDHISEWINKNMWSGQFNIPVSSWQFNNNIPDFNFQILNNKGSVLGWGDTKSNLPEGIFIPYMLNVAIEPKTGGTEYRFFYYTDNDSSATYTYKLLTNLLHVTITNNEH